MTLVERIGVAAGVIMLCFAIYFTVTTPQKQADEAERLNALVQEEGYSVVVDGTELSELPDNVATSAYNVTVSDSDKTIVCTTRQPSNNTILPVFFGRMG